MSRSSTQPRSPGPATRPGRGPSWLPAALSDAAFLALFVALGRRSHDESTALLGFLRTFWPFAVGATVGWVVARGWRAPSAVRRTGVLVWAGALVLGMLLRVVTGQGIAASFVLVATVVLAVFLIGWRAVLAWRRSARRP